MPPFRVTSFFSGQECPRFELQISFSTENASVRVTADFSRPIFRCGVTVSIHTLSGQKFRSHLPNIYLDVAVEAVEIPGLLTVSVYRLIKCLHFSYSFEYIQFTFVKHQVRTEFIFDTDTSTLFQQ
jgi:hypothetical protein